MSIFCHRIPGEQGVAFPAPEGFDGLAAPRFGWYLPCKRLADLLLATLLLVAAFPVIALFAALVKATSRGPAFYSQDRVGKNGRVFRIYKLRTMRHNAEAGTGPKWALPDDPRITGTGKVLRALHIDELPQLWNVIRGEMSLIGPRPERPEIVRFLNKMIPQYHRRMVISPGITGLAQIKLPADQNLSGVQKKLAYDLHYARNQSPWLDVVVLTATFFKVLGLPRKFLEKVVNPFSRL